MAASWGLPTEITMKICEYVVCSAFDPKTVRLYARESRDAVVDRMIYDWRNVDASKKPEKLLAIDIILGDSLDGDNMMMNFNSCMVTRREFDARGLADSFAAVMALRLTCREFYACVTDGVIWGRVLRDLVGSVEPTSVKYAQKTFAETVRREGRRRTITEEGTGVTLHIDCEDNRLSFAESIDNDPLTTLSTNRPLELPSWRYEPEVSEAHSAAAWTSYCHSEYGTLLAGLVLSGNVTAKCAAYDLDVVPNWDETCSSSGLNDFLHPMFAVMRFVRHIKAGDFRCEIRSKWCLYESVADAIHARSVRYSPEACFRCSSCSGVYFACYNCCNLVMQNDDRVMFNVKSCASCKR